MSISCLLGLDIGTLGVKGIVVTQDGRVLARARREHGVSHPQAGWAEQDADIQWWGDGLAVIRELLASPGVMPDAIAAVGVAGLTPCLCLVGATGRPLRPAILYSDNRALSQLAETNQALRTTLTAQAVTPKWRWLVEHEPDVVRSACCVLSSHDYVVYRLTGVLSMDYDTASIVGGVFDKGRKRWDGQACAAAGLDIHLLPALRAVTDVAGGVTAEVAAMTGLRAGTPVIAGTGDTFPTLVGCGAVEPGDAMISLGTTGLLTLTTRSLEAAAAGPHFVGAGEEGAVLWAANVLACGHLLAWFRDMFVGASGGASLRQQWDDASGGASLRQQWDDASGGASLPRDGVPDFAALDRMAALIPAGSDGLVALPHLMGRRTPTPDPAARGVLFGLTPSHTAAHIYRALLESFGYAVRRGFDPIRPRVRRVVATAGGAASPLWRQILADILETPVEHHPAASGALGIAFLAGYATGQVAGFRIIRDAWLAEPGVTAPNPATTEVYRQLYQVYCHLDDTLGPVYALLE